MSWLHEIIKKKKYFLWKTINLIFQIKITSRHERGELCVGYLCPLCVSFFQASRKSQGKWTLQKGRRGKCFLFSTTQKFIDFPFLRQQLSFHFFLQFKQKKNKIFCSLSQARVIREGSSFSRIYRELLGKRERKANFLSLHIKFQCCAGFMDKLWQIWIFMITLCGWTTIIIALIQLWGYLWPCTP